MTKNSKKTKTTERRRKQASLAKKSRKISVDEKNSLMLYLKEISRIPLIDKDEEEKIAKMAFMGDKAARDKLVSANLRFVIMIAKKYQGRGMPLEDLISEGNIGLLNAVRHFDAEKGFRFITYAVWWIRQSIMKALNEKGKMIRLPNNKNNELQKINKTRQSIQIEKGMDNDSEIKDTAFYLNTTPDKVTDLINISQDVISLDDPISQYGNALTIKDHVEDEYYLSPVEIALNSLLKDDVEAALNGLGIREAAVLRSRFGLGGEDSMTLKEIGNRYNLSREWIRQIEKRALIQLQRSSLNSKLESYIAG